MGGRSQDFFLIYINLGDFSAILCLYCKNVCKNALSVAIFYLNTLSSASNQTCFEKDTLAGLVDGR